MKEINIKDLFISFIDIIDQYHYIKASDNKKMVLISYYLAKELGLSREDIKDVVIAAAMDDIGVCDEISQVRSNSKVSKHELLGYSILKGYEPLHRVSTIILHHHIDYNDVLKGKFSKNEIDIGSYILRASHCLLERIIKKDSLERCLKEGCLHINSSSIEPTVKAASIKLIEDESFRTFYFEKTLGEVLHEVLDEKDFETKGNDLEEFLKMFARILDYKTHFTVYHSLVVSKISEAISRLLGYDELMVEFIKLTGYLHDVGKIGIPAKLFEKQEPLNDHDYNHIKQYKDMTLTILKDMKWFEYMFEVDEIDSDKVAHAKDILMFSEVFVALHENRPHRLKFEYNEISKIMTQEFNNGKLIKVMNLHYPSLLKIITTTINEEVNFFPKMFIPSYLKDYSIVY